MINFGVIGCGKIAHKHIALASSNLSEEINLMSACDLNKSIYNKICDEFKLHDIDYFDNYIDMINELNLKLVAILTPSGSHFEIAKNIILNTECDVIIEKPMCLRFEDALELNKIYKANTNKVYILMQNRFNRPIAAIRNFIDQGCLGDIHMCSSRVLWSRESEYYKDASWRGSWSEDGGALVNQGIHFLDLMIFLAGNVSEVHGFANKFLADIEAEDSLTANVQFNSGAIGTYSVTTATRPDDIEASITILGSKGYVEVGGFACNQIKFFKFTENKFFDDSEISNPSNNRLYAHQSFYQKVIDDIKKRKKQTFLDPYEGLKSLELIHAIYESVESGNSKKLDGNYTKTKLGY